MPMLQISLFVTISSEKVTAYFRSSGLGEPFCSPMAMREMFRSCSVIQALLNAFTWKPCKGPADTHPAIWIIKNSL
ncbi:hypothetical protein K456DRAFT_612889 [Colletotrichum gloeosporioides 23]|nr:hypothetical protein K456DRAFT_612889 [Colletotrichum gloeosporioides 23]